MSEESKSESEKKKEDWMNSKWRPMMGWMYMLVCTMDMVIFPILWSLLQAASHGAVNTQWQPLTLQGAGLFHIAMGAVLGIAAFGRTQEKLGGANNGGLQPTSQSVTTTYGSTPPGGFGGNSFGSAQPATSGFGGNSFGSTQPAAGGFGGNSFGSAQPAAGGFGGSSPSFGGNNFNSPATPAMSSTGKPMPVQPPQPEL